MVHRFLGLRAWHTKSSLVFIPLLTQGLFDFILHLHTNNYDELNATSFVNHVVLIVNFYEAFNRLQNMLEQYVIYSLILRSKLQNGKTLLFNQGITAILSSIIFK